MARPHVDVATALAERVLVSGVSAVASCGGDDSPAEGSERSERDEQTAWPAPPERADVGELLDLLSMVSATMSVFDPRGDDPFVREAAGGTTEHRGALRRVG